MKGLPDNTFPKKLKALPAVRRLVISGAEAMALGAIAAGYKFMAAYPMTPTTPIMEYFSEKAKEYDLVMVPAEDEIAAINMTIGAAYAGVRAMTTTSGGGFCLMVEGLGLAGMTETPIVVIEGSVPVLPLACRHAPNRATWSLCFTPPMANFRAWCLPLPPPKNAFGQWSKPSTSRKNTRCPF